MRDDNRGAIGGIGFFGLLQICFIVLRLCGVIQWNWIWVLAPMWGSFFLLLMIMLLIMAFYKDDDDRYRRL